MMEGSQFTAESLSGGREVSSLQSLSGGREVSSLLSLCREGGKSVNC